MPVRPGRDPYPSDRELRESVPLLDDRPALRFGAAQRRRPQGDRDGRHRQRWAAGNRRRVGPSPPLLSLADASRTPRRTAHGDHNKLRRDTAFAGDHPDGRGRPAEPVRDFWQPNTTYAVGAIILPQTPPQASPFSFVYRCVAINGSAKWSWDSAHVEQCPKRGQPSGDPSTGTPPNVIWQAMVDPLSVDRTIRWG